MKVSQLKDIIREIINEQIDAMDEDSEMANQAKAQGLDYMQFGRYGKDGKVTHKSEKGKLVPITKAQATKSTGMHFGRGKNANTMYSPRSYAPSATFDPKMGKVQKNRPSDSPAAQQKKNAPKDSLAPDYSGQTSSDKIISKVSSMVPIDIDNQFDYGAPIPMRDFQAVTGITQKAAKYYSDNEGGYEKLFDYDPDTDSVTMWDPADV
jgi:hypothetical protein